MAGRAAGRPVLLEDALRGIDVGEYVRGVDAPTLRSVVGDEGRAGYAVGGASLTVPTLAGTSNPDAAERAAESAIVLVVAGAPGSTAAGEAAARRGDLTVVVAIAGARQVDVQRTVRVLQQFNIKPAWGILASRDWLKRADTT